MWVQRVGTMPSMMANIDKLGRVVIPKEIRDRLSLGPESSVEITIEGDEIRLTPLRDKGRTIVEVGGWPVLQPIGGMTLTDRDVQRLRDADQR